VPGHSFQWELSAAAHRVLVAHTHAAAEAIQVLHRRVAMEGGSLDAMVSTYPFPILTRGSRTFENCGVRLSRANKCQLDREQIEP